MAFLNRKNSGDWLMVEKAIHDMAIAYVSSRKDTDKMSVGQFYDEYAKAADDMEALYHRGKASGISN